MTERHTMKQRFTHFFTLLWQAVKGGEEDYTQGSIRRAVFLLAIPMILELSLESVFALVDMFFVGKLGQNAIATVGLTESVVTIVYSAAIGLSTAATALVARRIGEKNPDAAAQAGAQVMLLSCIVAVVLSVAGICFAPDVLHLMGATPEVIKEGVVFTRIMLGGSVAILLLFLLNGIFRGAGDAAMAMRSLIIASLINIILCPLFIHFFGLKGAAIATLIGRSTGVLYQCYYLVCGKGLFQLRAAHFRPDWPVLRSLVNIAWPATLQFLIASASWIVLARLVALTGGTTASAGYQIAIRNVVFFILPAWGLSNAAATLVGQNLGAQQVRRAEQSALLCTRYNIYFMSLVMLLFLFFSGPIVGLFTTDAAVREQGASALQIMGAGYVFYGIGMVMMQALNGAGDTKAPTWINFICFWLLQIPLAYILSASMEMGTTGVFLAIPIAETCIAVAAWWLFKKGRWKTVKV